LSLDRLVNFCNEPEPFKVVSKADLNFYALTKEQLQSINVEAQSFVKNSAAAETVAVAEEEEKVEAEEEEESNKKKGRPKKGKKRRIHEEGKYYITFMNHIILFPSTYIYTLFLDEIITLGKEIINTPGFKEIEIIHINTPQRSRPALRSCRLSDKDDKNYNESKKG
jgi:hypothetical protein